MKKSKVYSIARKNRIVSNIQEAMISRDRFLLMGHKNPDEDCVASMIAFGLLLVKFSKEVFLMIRDSKTRNFQYLLNICKYNSITILEPGKKKPGDISTVVCFDTPKPVMLDCFDDYRDLFDDKRVLKIEVDHHLEADSAYIGDPEYCLVDEASSSCELVGYLGCKLNRRKTLLEQHQVADLFSRNFVLSVLTGIIGDSKMGRYLKTDREKWFYRLFSGIFDELLSKKTIKNSSNFSSMGEVFDELERLSEKETLCVRYMMKRKELTPPYFGSILLTAEDMAYLSSKCDVDTIVTVARYTADKIAEESGYVSLVVYYDDPSVSDLVQFRMRRSQTFQALDLREILGRMHIENGGGHPGAIGFRIPRDQVDDIGRLMEDIRGITGEMIDNSLKREK